MIDTFKNDLTSILKNGNLKQWNKLLKDLYNNLFT